MSTDKSRYNDFDTFLADVVTKARERSDELKRKYEVRNMAVLKVIVTILTMVGGGYIALVVISALCAAGVISFPAALVAFLSTPLGWILAGVFGVALVSTMWMLYRDRRILRAVKEVGAKVKEPHAFLVRTNADVSRFDRLFEEAVVALLVDPKEFYSNRSVWDEVEISRKFRDSFSRGGS